jgi:hypothetical protein
MDRSRCPDENQLAEFSSGSAGRALKSNIEAHLDTCAECTDLLASLALTYGTSAGAEESQRAGTDPESIRAPPLQRNGWGADAVLAVLAATHLSTLALLGPGAMAYLRATHVPPTAWPVHLAAGLLGVSLVGLAVASVAAVQRLKGARSVTKVSALAILSWFHPAAVVLVTLYVVVLSPTLSPTDARKLSRQLMHLSIPLHGVLISTLLYMDFLHAEPALAASVSGAGVTVALFGVVTGLGHLLAPRTRAGTQRSLALASSVVALLNPITTPLGVGILLLRSRGGSARVPPS